MADKMQQMAALDAMMQQGGGGAPPGPGGPPPGPGAGAPVDPSAAGGVNCQVCGYVVGPDGTPIDIWDPALAEAVAPFEDPGAGAPPGPGAEPPAGAPGMPAMPPPMPFG